MSAKPSRWHFSASYDLGIDVDPPNPNFVRATLEPFWINLQVDDETYPQPRIRKLVIPGVSLTVDPPEIDKAYYLEELIFPELKFGGAFWVGRSGVKVIRLPKYLTSYDQHLGYSSIWPMTGVNNASLRRVEFPAAFRFGSVNAVPSRFFCNFQNCALDQETVDRFLRCAVLSGEFFTPGLVSGLQATTFRFDGGTNSPPSAQGLIDVDTLRSRGAYVFHN